MYVLLFIPANIPVLCRQYNQKHLEASNNAISLQCVGKLFGASYGFSFFFYR